MALKLIHAARVYKAVLPPAAEINALLPKLAHKELGPTTAFGAGFVPVEPSEKLFVYPFQNGYAFAVRYDEKIVPASVVKAELKKWAADFDAREGFKPGRKLLRETKEQVIYPTLLAQAFVRSKVIRCFYNPAEHILIVPTASKKLANFVMDCLVRAVEAVKTTTINVAGANASLTVRLLGHLNCEGGFEDFTVGGVVKMQGKDGDKFSFDLDSVDQAEEGIREAAAAGANVAEIALELNGVRFRLGQDFVLKGIKFEDELIQYEQDGDPFNTFEQEAAIQLLLVGKVIDALCTMFDYKPAAESEDDLI